MRPPQVRTTAFISYICQIYCIHFGQYWTLFCNANSSSAYSLISGSCSSDRDFAFSFLQIPSCDGHPCYWLMVATTKPHNGLSPSSCRPCWAHHKNSGRNSCRNLIFTVNYIFINNYAAACRIVSYCFAVYYAAAFYLVHITSTHNTPHTTVQISSVLLR